MSRLTCTELQAMRARFDALCRESLDLSAVRDSDRIGTYNEKTLHKLLKRAVCEDESAYEVKVGPYIADVRKDGRIFEIQTGSFYPLFDKLQYFLENTEDEIIVVHPQNFDLTILRIDPDTGELLHKKRSPKKERPRDLFCELYFLRELFPNDRLTVLSVSLCAEEYRYSERVRGRRTGAYDAYFQPLSWLDQTDISTPADVSALIPPTLLNTPELSADDIGRALALRPGRRRWRAITFLCECGVLNCRKEGRKNVYNLIGGTS